jgi:hypothetical protein
MFSFHIYMPFQLPPFCYVGIVVILIYCSILVIFFFLFLTCTILIDPFPTKCLEFMWWENDLFVWPTWLSVILTPCYLWLETEFGTLCLFFLACLLYYASIFLFLALNSRVAIVLLSVKFSSYYNSVYCSLFVKLMWDIFS